MKSLALSLFVCTLAAQPDAAAKLYEDYYEWLLRENPEFATSVGRAEYNERWSSQGPGAIERSKTALLAFQERARSITPPSQDRLTHRLFQEELSALLRVADTAPYLAAVNHYIGPHQTPARTFTLAPANIVRDYENLISRLEALPSFADGVMATASEALRRKLLAPRLTAELVVKQLDFEIATPPDRSPLLAAFRRFPASIPEAERSRLRARAEAAYQQKYLPAWKKLRQFVVETYIPATRDSIGLKDNFNGQEIYQSFIRNSTTTRLTASEVHQIGLREMARIESEMAGIRKELQFTGSPREFDEKVLQSEKFRFHTEEEILAHGRDIAKRIDPELPKLFKNLPRMPYGVRAIPAARARTAAPFYQPPALDGSRAGYFHLRTVDPQTQSKCCMAALILHEAVPGHHLQIALAREIPHVPEFRKLGRYTAYSEGWGLYAETLGGDLGVYDTPFERYGKLQQEVMRAARLVVDTGIHALGWNREKAVQTMMVAQGGWITEDFLRSEVDRYIANPAQALAYKIGGLKMEELRRKSEKALGSRFDVREFHDVVLRNGALPLDILEEEVDAWIARTR
jgi:uncharacterized protein (DUF885 family)